MIPSNYPTLPSPIARVTAGARFLDIVSPGWEKLINLKVLDIARGDNCVLGQLGQLLDKDNCDVKMAYLVAADAFGLDTENMLLFGLTGPLDDLPSLTMAWTILIGRRLEVHVHHVDLDDDLVVLNRIDECDSGIGGMVLRVRNVATAEITVELGADLVVSA